MIANRLRAGLVAGLLLLFAFPAAAQDARGTVLGRVTDASGAMVPNAEVRITREHGRCRALKTNGSSSYGALLPDPRRVHGLL